MPAGPGETLLTTLFADVHYYFSDPASYPPHHRFDRGSYLYIYQNPANSYAKLEIANNAGTPEQDAFSGSLNNIASLSYSHNQPTRCSINVSAASAQDYGQWHLPALNEKNEQRYLYKIHTLDLYLWTEKDAATFLKHSSGVLPADRLDIRDAPAAMLAEHRDSMSPVVQQLERTAIGSHFPPRAGSTTSAQSFPGPPTPAGTSSPAPSTQQAPAVMAYNPAAPPAPEPIQYREKTPPPPDDGRGTGLGHAAKYEHLPVTQFANAPAPGPPGYHSSQPTPQSAYFSGPPAPPAQNQQQHQHQPSTTHVQNPSVYSLGGGIPPPPPGGPSPHSQPFQQQQQGSYNPSFAGAPTSPPPHQQSFSRQSSYMGAPQQQLPTTQFANCTSSSFGPSIQSPGMMPPTPSAPPAYAQLQSPGLPPPPPGGPPSQGHTPQPPPLQHSHSYTSSHQSATPPQQQVHAYSTYNYSNITSGAHQQNVHGAYTGDVHNQAYRPTEAEAAHGHHSNKSKKPEKQSTGPRLEDRVQGVEKRVGLFLKRLDKLV